MNQESDFKKICGLDVFVVTPCRCGSPLFQLHPHSTKSEIPVWKCVWCRERLAKVTEVQAKLLESYVKKFGWPSDPLIFHEDGGIYAYGSKV